MSDNCENLIKSLEFWDTSFALKEVLWNELKDSSAVKEKVADRLHIKPNDTLGTVMMRLIEACEEMALEYEEKRRIF